MSKLGIDQIRIWQWPNVLSLDAALIAVLWQCLFGISISSPTTPGAAYVLALSVWLTYSADRLFDASRRPVERLLSTRHRFAKAHAPKLWRIWWLVLAINTSIAFTKLSHAQLHKGFILLAICLIYTLLNQKLSRSYFPKQICVALIFAGGVIVFHPVAQLWLSGISLTLLCLLNCQLISQKEIDVNTALGEHSLLSRAPYLNIGLIIATFGICFLQPSAVTFSIATNAAIYFGLYLKQHEWPTEAYRVLIDGSLILTPSITLIALFIQAS